MLYRIFIYFKFIFTATNQHGVHSPFIYDFVTKCLYNKSRIKHPKTIGILLECCFYFKAKTVNIVPKNMHIQRLVRNIDPGIGFDKPPFDIIYMEQPNETTFTKILTDGSCQNKSMILINDIHLSKRNSQAWELLKNNPRITVTIDMFYCGALFLRREQAKEHFKIRI